ncbi:MAG: bifunctional DNA-binding transcriptional regulator/O6-methylguanine-DNA methyltransferase Ada [Novosphingobium sp.]|nr:bifunctional DNA-binding transcriptional regulator/O6-methylguanine-DNA methyltransferase Ada [Novosphingobium sp.]
MNQLADISTDAAWAAFEARDRSFDGRFVVAVTTTAIYCRPSCPARRPRRENVVILPDGSAARAAGFRACKRCRPDNVSRDLAVVERVLALLHGAEETVPLARLARETGYSPSHLQRIFKRAVGLSPAEYARALRIERAGDALSAGSSVTDAVYEAGFGAPSRFYEASKGRLGMAPTAWANGGHGVTIRWAVVETSLGRMLVAATEKGVCRLSFDEGPDELRERFPKAELAEGGAEFAALLKEVVSAVEQPGDSRAIPLDVQGTAFQEAVWAELRKIPIGETRSYAEIAAAIGKPGAVRAAGSANGANAVAVLIPCHRVIRSDGSLGGYAYGEDIKRELLKREQRD